MYLLKKFVDLGNSTFHIVQFTSGKSVNFKSAFPHVPYI